MWDCQDELRSSGGGDLDVEATAGDGPEHADSDAGHLEDAGQRQQSKQGEASNL